MAVRMWCEMWKWKVEKGSQLEFTSLGMRREATSKPFGRRGGRKECGTRRVEGKAVFTSLEIFLI
jgi:hypothetical protein